MKKKSETDVIMNSSLSENKMDIQRPAIIKTSGQSQKQNDVVM